MPLPSALAAKLARRGILSAERNLAGDEEVIAESYDKPQEGLVDHNIDEFGNPLPPPWEKVWEPEFETWYYWETVTDKVSWLPPSDPDAVITYPKSKSVHIKKPPELVRDKIVEKIPRSRPKPEKRRSRMEEEFDPMDPSSYSDAPKGKWSTGLKKLDDAKTGVDSTANGPLFQQRPYPSPGEVLSRNKMANRDYGPTKP
uniref:Polyglutamine-binding protein 1 n=1 Tax=Phallusia mammillata TaxID=59560 RepID=A0A6F9DQ61_9ASCI|nr:polyglutamine-binding protein 1-like [Phallusia mammillata]